MYTLNCLRTFHLILIIAFFPNMRLTAEHTLRLLVEAWKYRLTSSVLIEILVHALHACHVPWICLQWQYTLEIVISSVHLQRFHLIWMYACNRERATGCQLISRVSCQKGPTHHTYAWQIGPFWQDTLAFCCQRRWDLAFFHGHQQNIQSVLIDWRSVPIHVRCSWYSVGNKVITSTTTITSTITTKNNSTTSTTTTATTTTITT